MKRKYRLSPDLKRIPGLYIYDFPSELIPRESLLLPGFMDFILQKTRAAQERGQNDIVFNMMHLVSTSCFEYEPRGDGRFFAIFKEFLSGLSLDEVAASHIWHFILSNRIWMKTGQKSFLLSPGLYERLSQTRLDNLNVKDLRLPFKDFYIQFEGRNTGVFISYGPPLTLSVLSPGVVHSLYEIPTDAVISIEPDTEDAELAQVALCASIYLTTKNPDMMKISETQGYRDAAKNRDRLRKKDRKLFDAIRKTVANVTWLGSRIRVTPRREVAPSAGGTHASPIPHWRQGHFRRQAIGPRGGGAHKTIWIEPQPIGFDGTEPPLSAALPRIREVKGSDS